MNPALFRFGFICFPAGEQPIGDSLWRDLVTSWERFEQAALVVHHHPEARVRRRVRDGASATLIGDAYASPAGRSVESILDDLLTPEGDERLFEKLDELSGRFALLLSNGSTQRAFHDPIGSRSLFYRAVGEFCLGSHSELLARAFGHEESSQARAVMSHGEYRSRSAMYLPGDLTVYEGVRALAPNNFYDIGGRRTVRYWPRHRRRATTFDDFFPVLDDHLIGLATYLRDRYLPVLGVTPGIDSRALIAAFGRHDLAMEGVTWLRRSGEIDPREREVIEGVLSRARIPHSYLKLAEAGPGARRTAAVARRNAGSYGRPSRITARLHRHFRGRDAVFVRGWGAEVIRGFYNVRIGSGGRRLLRGLRSGRPRTRATAIAELTPAALLKAYHSSSKVSAPSEEYMRTALPAFEGFMERANYDERLTRAGFDLSDVFYWEHRMGMWGSSKHNELDPALLAMVGFNSRAVFEAAFGLDPSERLTRELLRAVVRRYDEPMARFPYL